MNQLYLSIIVSILFFTNTHLTTKSNVFLIQGQSYLLFPHRNFQLTSTYTTNCTAQPRGLVIQHYPLSTVALINFNNSNIGLSILSENTEVSSVFYYGKISAKGVCSIYQVQQQSINILYEHNFKGQFQNLILINKFYTFLWNNKTIARIEYILDSRAAIVVMGQFSYEAAWSCKRYEENTVVCWCDNQFLLISPKNALFSEDRYQWMQENSIKQILPLSYKQNAMFICTLYTCNIVRLMENQTYQVIQSYPLVMPVLGSDIDRQTNSIAIVHSTAASLYIYNSQTDKILLEQTLSFDFSVSCVHISSVHILLDQILISCSNFIGQSQSIIFLKDIELNKYYAYDSWIQNSMQSNCQLDGNKNYIFAVCNNKIVTKYNNFFYYEINSTVKGSKILIECYDIGLDSQYNQLYELNVIYAVLNNAYLDKPISSAQWIYYDSIYTLKLKDKFIASSIQYYSVQSQNCPYFETTQYKKLDYLYYFSLYNREKCVQIVSNQNGIFYRVIQINETIFYIEACSEIIEVGYVCRLVEIAQNLLFMRLVIKDNTIFKLYLQDSYLMMISNGISKRVFQSQVSSYELKYLIIRIRINNTYYFNTISNVINNCENWINQEDQASYSFSNDMAFEISKQGLVREYQNNLIVSHSTLNLKLTLTKKKSITLPFIFKRGYYVFIINETHITKLFTQSFFTIIYQLPYNINSFQIQSIKNTDIYLIIQYQIGFLEVYDTQQGELSALIATIQQSILCDLIIMDKNMILLPIKSQTYLVKINDDPVLSLHLTTPYYSKFSQSCNFMITLYKDNGSCPFMVEDTYNLNQTFSLGVKFNIKKIDLDNHISLIEKPQQCKNCIESICEYHFKGPIFAYQLNDDYYNAFLLVPHLKINNCEASAEVTLFSMVQIKNEQDTALNEIMTMNKTHILLINNMLQPIFNFQVKNIIFCISYLTINEYYVVLCDRVFVIFNKTGQISMSKHNIIINHNQKNQFELQKQFIRDDIYYIYIIDHELFAHVYVLQLDKSSVEFISFQKFDQTICDFKIVNDQIIVLEQKQLCRYTTQIQAYQCYNLSSIIPKQYALTYEYEEFLPYFSSGHLLRGLLISNNYDNLHIDLQINFDQVSFNFSILNLYAGYQGYIFKDVISISTSNDTYINFILYYQQQTYFKQNFIAYYQYNSKFNIDQSIGQIRSAEFLQNYFNQPLRFNFFSFTNRLYIAHDIKLVSDDKRQNQCKLVNINDHLRIIMNYEQPPPLKFLILKAKNSIYLESHYVKIKYIHKNQIIIQSLISLGCLLFTFVLIIVFTNRCKEKKQEITIHFISEQIQNQDSDKYSSDLLHSNSSPRSETEHQQD